MVNKYKKIVLVFIILFGFGLRFYAAKSIHVTWDEEMTFKPIQEISFNSKNLNLPLLDSNPVYESSPMVYRYLIKIVWCFFGESLLITRLFFIILGVFIILLVYSLTKQSLGAEVALLSSFLVSISQFQVALDRTANNAPLHLVFVLLSLFLFYRAVQNADKKLMALNGIVLGVGFWVKESMVLLVPVYFIFLLAFSDYRKWLKDKSLWLSFIAAGFIACPLMIYGQLQNASRAEYLSSIKSIGPSLNGIGLYLGELILLAIKWFGSTGFFHSVLDTLTRETSPVNFLLGIVILAAVVRAIRKKSSLIRLLVICFLFNFLLFCFIRKSDVIDGIWSLGSLEWGMMGFIPGVILASDMLVGYAKKRKITGGIFLLLLVAFVLVRTWNMVSYPLCCYFPEKEWCIKDELYNKAFRYNKEGKIKRAKETLKKVYQVTRNDWHKTDAVLRLARILKKQGKLGEAKRYLYDMLSDHPGNRRVLEMLKSLK